MNLQYTMEHHRFVKKFMLNNLQKNRMDLFILHRIRNFRMIYATEPFWFSIKTHRIGEYAAKAHSVDQSRLKILDITIFQNYIS